MFAAKLFTTPIKHKLPKRELQMERESFQKSIIIPEINKEIVEKKEIVEEEKEGVYFDIIPKKRKRRGYLTNKINNV